jgi:hypothetical protein
MFYSKQTTENFMSMMDELTTDFQNQHDTYEWNFKSNLESFGHIKYFIITNRFQTVTLKYNPDSKSIIRTIISDVDIDRINKLKDGLK